MRKYWDQISGASDDSKDKLTAHLLEAITRYSQPDPPGSLGAAKTFQIPEADPERAKALGRLEREIKALKGIDKPGIVRLIEASLDDHWILTEYHPGGTLADHLDRFRGNGLAALEAFRPLVEAVAALHEKKIIHRDIKPENIFIAADGRLVLGDFGIVFFQDAEGTRLTESLEKVGTRDWMAPWAHTGERVELENVNPTFDVFPLGKVLWAMVSGRKTMPYWDWSRDRNNVILLNPQDDAGPFVNEILARTIVENEIQCLGSATELLQLVDSAVQTLGRRGELLHKRLPRHCRVCGRGFYELLFPGQEPERLLGLLEPSQRQKAMTVTSLFAEYRAFPVRLLGCNQCGHLQLFRYPPDKPPTAWTSGL